MICLKRFVLLFSFALTTVVLTATAADTNTVPRAKKERSKDKIQVAPKGCDFVL